MSPRFTIDLLHAGQLERTRRDWFVGAQGQRYLLLLTVVGATVLLLVLVVGIVPLRWRLADDLRRIDTSRQELARTTADADLLRSNLRALSAEAARQVRWGELLATFSLRAPASLKLQSVSWLDPVPAESRGRPASSTTEATTATLQIEAVTPLRAGSAALLDVANFMAELMRDPQVNRRFQLERWEVKPPGAETNTARLLRITISLTERVP